MPAMRRPPKACADSLGVMIVKGNVGEFEDCRKAVAAVEAELGPIDVLVNNAGITRDAMLHRMTPRAVERGDLRQPRLYLQHEPPSHRRHARAQLRPDHQCLLHQRSKGTDGSDQLFRRQGRRDRLHQGSGPGDRPPRASPSTPSPPAISIPTWWPRLPPNVLEQIIANIPVGRLGKAEEIAACVAFLAREDAGFVTGATLTVNGGQYMAG